MKSVLPILTGLVLICIVILGTQQNLFLKMFVLDSDGFNLTKMGEINVNNNAKEDVENIENNTSTFDFNNVDFGKSTGFNFLSLIDNINRGQQNTQEQKYYKNLIEVYNESYQGKYNFNSSNNPSPSYLSAMHKNETNWGEFLKDFVGEKYSGGLVDLRITNEEVLSELIPNYKQKIGSSGVYANDGGDDYPDGAFQVIKGSPTDHLDAVSKDSKKDTYDTYSIRDQINVVSNTFAQGKSELNASGVNVSLLVENMYGAGKHNRGSYIRQAYGIAYEPASNKLKISNYLKSIDISNEDIMKEQLYALEVIERMFKQYSLPYLSIYTEERTCAGALSWVILLKDGWLIEEEPSKSFRLGLNKLYSLTDDLNPVLKIFPEWKTIDIALTEISNKYIKSLFTSLSVSPDECDKRYGTVNGTYSGRVIDSQGSIGSYSTIYKNTGKTNPNYVNRESVLVKAYDFVSTQYWIQIGIVSESSLVELAIKAGIPEQIDGRIVDASNPDLFYSEQKDTYNPKYGQNDSNLKSILDLLDESVNEIQYISLVEAYKELGLPYAWGGGGLFYDSGQGTWIGNKNSGKYAIDFYSKGKPYDGRRMYDCSSFASVLGSLGNFNSSGGPKYMYNSSSWVNNIGLKRNATVKSQDVDITLLQVNLNGSTSEKFSGAEKAYMSIWGDVLKPGDIIATNGHAEIYLGSNNNSSSIVIPVEYTMSNKDSVSVKPNQSVWFNNGGGSPPDYTSGVTTYLDKERAYWALRLKCNN